MMLLGLFPNQSSRFKILYEETIHYTVKQCAVWHYWAKIIHDRYLFGNKSYSCKSAHTSNFEKFYIQFFMAYAMWWMGFGIDLGQTICQ